MFTSKMYIYVIIIGSGRCCSVIYRFLPEFEENIFFNPIIIFSSHILAALFQVMFNLKFNLESLLLIFHKTLCNIIWPISAEICLYKPWRSIFILF